jgi:peptide/nickel transport system ATP-binding protein
MSSLLSVQNLKTSFFTDYGLARAVDGLSFDIDEGQVLAIVGESGSGKSVTALSILQLIPTPPGLFEDGRILFEGRDLMAMSKSEIRAVRGNDISMIFQEPMTSLNPVYTVGSQIMEAILLHQDVGRREAREKAIELLDLVGISSPGEFVDNYPHQLSGGMRQRVMIAIALACNPKLLIADEPTTALDVTIQAQIFDLLRSLQQDRRMAVILITHDLGVVAEFVDYVIVMYAGRAVEQAPIHDLFERPLHPYTEGLLNSIPKVDTDMDRLEAIDGTVPSPFDMPSGCPFHPRCKYAEPACEEAVPPLVDASANHSVACIRHTPQWENKGRAEP